MRVTTAAVKRRCGGVGLCGGPHDGERPEQKERLQVRKFPSVTLWSRSMLVLLRLLRFEWSIPASTAAVVRFVAWDFEGDAATEDRNMLECGERESPPEW